MPGYLQEVHLNTLTRTERYHKTGQGGTFTDLSSAFENSEPDEDVEFFDPLEISCGRTNGWQWALFDTDHGAISWFGAGDRRPVSYDKTR